MPSKLFSKSTLLLFAAGLGMNILFVWLTDILGIPLYLDSIGTVLAGALGGALPGIAVGYLSNLSTALLSVSPDPMTLYYGFLNVLIAVIATVCSLNGMLLHRKGRILTVLILTFIGGALGSVVTWVLYGFTFGQGVSAPLAAFFHYSGGMSQFSAQLGADLTIDLLDKSITVLAVCGLLHVLPNRVLENMPLGNVYLQKKPARLRLPVKKGQGWRASLRSLRLRSVRTRVTALIVASTVILSGISLVISGMTYYKRLMGTRADLCSDVVSMMLAKIDGNRVEAYLEQGEAAPGYADTRQDLYDIFENTQDLQYMYVYSIQPDGCHVVFDLDTPDLPGEPAGTVVDFDDSFPYVEDALAGREIPPVITDDTYGWLLTVYQPVRNSENKVVAYAAADIDMQNIRVELYSFLISIASLQFGILVLLTAFSLWYCDKCLLQPMSALVTQVREFDYEGAHLDKRKHRQLAVHTGDEIEEIFNAMCLTEDAIAGHVAQLNQKNLEISLMQRNIIYALANMVENRDGSTGEHIKRTAQYVRLMGEGLLQRGAVPNDVDAEYIKMLYESAPLHDIGKVIIPDAILNKPGKLTAEERSLMKTHTTAGADILRSSLSDIEDGSWLSIAIDMAEFHHERWDGQGYPKGLAGEEIPLCARIMAVADVFDALISVRSYKKAFPFDLVMEMLTEGAGTQFDPQVVEVFTSERETVRHIVDSTKPLHT